MSFQQKSNAFIFVFLPEYESTNNNLLISAKITCLRKIWFLSCNPKAS